MVLERFSFRRKEIGRSSDTRDTPCGYGRGVVVFAVRWKRGFAVYDSRISEVRGSSSAVTLATKPVAQGEKHALCRHSQGL